ncbi:MAG: hydratase [Oscillospiraceae bacterium]|jgi:aconitate hydratase|nr:hydratase [Oscillospiraceae bacterium]
MNRRKAVEYSCKVTKIVAGKPVVTPDTTDIIIGREKTLAYKIIRKHEAAAINENEHKNSKNDEISIKFDALVSHDITYVSIIQAARAAGMTEFPVPYALTNCHNSLCAVGGTINEDDHVFGLSAAKKYGGIYVPANQAVIHQYAREVLAGCGKMILGSDSHTRYGSYGTLGIGEGGGELVKQLLEGTYDIAPPEVVLVWLEGTPKHGIGPHDVALALIKEVFPDDCVKNKILEFAGPGINSLSMDFRAGIDVMTTETACLTSIWETDDKVKAFYNDVGRPDDFIEMKIENNACYDAIIKIDLSAIESMIALPFHPSKAFTIHELQNNAKNIFEEIEALCNEELGDKVKLDLIRNINQDGNVFCEQGVIVGCAGGLYENISEAADILSGKSIGDDYFELSVYPSSTPVSLAITKDGIVEELIKTGTLVKSAFCGPCFGAGDTPANNTLSIRHATRNFAAREGSKPNNGQIAAVALMDARSIAATAINGGILTAATDIDYAITPREYIYDSSIYEKRCYNGFGKPNPSVELRLGPNITDWPRFLKPEENLLLKLCAIIRDEVTTTDELIPSGETSSYRSNPKALAEFTLSRRVPEYVESTKAVQEMDEERQNGKLPTEVKLILKMINKDISNTTIGSCIFANKPGDGSAREQAASCQRVLGGLANICYEFATKRYRSNCINWGIAPFTISKNEPFDYSTDDWIYIPNYRSAILSGAEIIPAKMIKPGDIMQPLLAPPGVFDIMLKCNGLSDEEKKILTAGCLMNYYMEVKHTQPANSTS